MAPLPRAILFRASRAVALGAAGVLVFASVAYGVVSPSVVASGPSPFAACTDGQSSGPPPGEVFVNAEVEPWVAVNPTNPDNLVGVWQQDRWTDGGSKGLSTARSTNGGATWSAVAPIPWSTCAGSTDAEATRATDPWVSFGPDGTAHQIALVLDPNGFMTGVLASRSTDGGATWSAPANISDLGSGAAYKTPAGFGEVYGDYGEIAITNTGKTIAAWGEGASYDGPGAVWINRQN